MNKKHYLRKFYKTLFGTLLFEFALGYLAFRSYQFFYPQNEWKHYTEENEVLDVEQKMEQRVTADTEWIIEEIGSDTGAVSRYRQAVPEFCLDMDRNALSKHIRIMKESPSLEEKQKGLYDAELNTFSAGRVIIRKYYNPPNEKGYYLLVKNHYVSVYNFSKTNCLQDTNILLEKLPDLLQEQIIAGKFMDNQESLYNFLETYTS